MSLVASRHWVALACATLMVVSLPTVTVTAETTSEAPAEGYEALDWVVESSLRQPHMNGAVAAVLVRSLSTGEVLYEHNSDRPMTPASKSWACPSQSGS